MAKALILTLSLLFLLSCQETAEKNMQDLGRHVKQLRDKAGEKIDQLSSSKEQVSEMTSEEFEKLSIFEYKIEELPLKSETAEIEQLLSNLGKQRWECFDVLQTEKTLRIFCKRRPETYLRYIPRIFPF